MALAVALFILTASLALVFYVRLNDRKLTRISPHAIQFAPTRWSEADIDVAARMLEIDPTPIEEHLPPKTGRRYIITGGAGFVGGWIVNHLLQRGENPKNIRILDVRAPTRRDLASGAGKEVQFIKVNIVDAAAVKDAFLAPWSDEASGSDITVFHTVAIIRFFERQPAFLALSANVNVVGTQNVIDAARAAGTSILVFTSSCTVTTRSQRFFLWPWETETRHVIQVTDDGTTLPNRHEDFAANYCITKLQAEQLVRSADRLPSDGGRVLRTGCLRPGTVIYGPGGDVWEHALRSNGGPALTSNFICNCLYVENCSLAHLCYEQRLIELGRESSNPDIGGQAFLITDPGQPTLYRDMMFLLGKLSNGQIAFHNLSPTLILLISHVVERYCLLRQFLQSTTLGSIIKLPAITGDLLNIQPATLNVSLYHSILDDSRARLPPEKGGLGYKGAWTTMEGVCRTWFEYKTNGSLNPGMKAFAGKLE